MTTQTTTVWPTLVVIALGVAAIIGAITCAVFAARFFPLLGETTPQPDATPTAEAFIRVIETIGLLVGVVLFTILTALATGLLVIGVGLLGRHEWARHDAAFFLILVAAGSVAFLVSALVAAGQTPSTGALSGVGDVASIPGTVLVVVCALGLVALLEMHPAVREVFRDTHERPIGGFVAKPKTVPATSDSRTPS